LPKNYDLFISHTAEDRDFVRSLADALRRKGLSVWYDEAQIHSGDALGAKIDAGLSQSNFAVVVLSPDFLSKDWPQHEVHALLSHERDQGTPRILPLWHKVSAQEVARSSPLLADRIAVSSDVGVDEVAERLRAVVSRGHETRRSRCLVLSEFSADYAPVYESIAAALDEAGVDSIRVDQQPTSAALADKVIDLIRSADFVVADISASSPNLFYEIGMVHGMKKPIILLMDTKSKARMPFDLSGYRFLPYDPDRPVSLIPDLRRVARLYADSQGVG
jgi:hypothetical protein